MANLHLSAMREIPFNLLQLSDSNVRTRINQASIEQLAEDISRRGLLQSLSVRAITNDDGTPGNRYEVQAGGRRYRALAMLVKSKRLNKTTPIPCIVRDDGSAEEDSLAENVQREDLTPVEQYRAFRTLADKGQSEAEIAATFFVSTHVVKQRLRLANVAPSILEAYENADITLDILQAFAVTTDQERQTSVYDWLQKQPTYQQTEFIVRRRLAETSITANDKRVKFIGLERYKERGGSIDCDLFSDEGNIFLTDSTLLETMVTEKLREESMKIVAEGWLWIDAQTSFSYSDSIGFHRIEGNQELSPESAKRIDDIEFRIDEIYESHANYDEMPDDMADELEMLETELEELRNGPPSFTIRERMVSGCRVSIGHSGRIEVERGLVKPENVEAALNLYKEDEEDEEDSPEADSHGNASDDRQGYATDINVLDAGKEQDSDDEDNIRKPVSDALRTELSTTHTVALQNAVAENPHMALTLLLHSLCSQAFFLRSHNGCLNVSIIAPNVRNASEDLGEMPFTKALLERDDIWKAALPKDVDLLWPAIDDMSDDKRLALLAHLTSKGVNAIHEKTTPHGSVSEYTVKQRTMQAKLMAARLGMDMAEAGWRPTQANYFSRVSKPHILDSVEEACGKEAVQLISHLKKADMAREAERLVNPTNWVPSELRPVDLSDTDTSHDAQAKMTELPDFLADEEDEDTDPDDSTEELLEND